MQEDCSFAVWQYTVAPQEFPLGQSNKQASPSSTREKNHACCGPPPIRQGISGLCYPPFSTKSHSLGIVVKTQENWKVPVIN